MEELQHTTVTSKMLDVVQSTALAFTYTKWVSTYYSYW